MALLADPEAPLVIVGAGLAGWTVAREFRKLNSTTPVVLVTADQGDFYAKPSLSNAFAQRRSPEQLVTTPAAALAASLKVVVHAFTRVTAIDTAQRRLHTAQGDLHYSKLVLALGANPIRLPLAGNAADQVFSVNSLDDFRRFHAVLLSARATDSLAGNTPAPRHVVIMGAGLIGCEFANDLVRAGHAVTVVDPNAQPLAALVPAGAGELMATHLGTAGVVWQLCRTVVAVNRATNPEANHLAVSLSDGQVLQADVVLSAIGLRAEISLAQASGLQCERGVVVDAIGQTSAPQVYALGDCAQYAQGQWRDDHVSGGQTLPFVMPIMQAAKQLAATLCGTPTRRQLAPMPVTVKTPDLPLVALPPQRERSGQWQVVEPGRWSFQGEGSPAQFGFVLTGALTSQRVAQVAMTRA